MKKRARFIFDSWNDKIILPQFENHPNPMVSEEAEEYRKKYNSFISNLYY